MKARHIKKLRKRIAKFETYSVNKCRGINSLLIRDYSTLIKAESPFHAEDIDNLNSIFPNLDLK